MSEAVDKRAVRRRRIWRIRHAVVALSLAMFIALFAGLYVQMAAGRDPALGSQTAATSSTSGDTSSAAASGDTGASSDNAANSSAPSAVTTSQS
jgi:uncharacterized iron-regulated membrane protein